MRTFMFVCTRSSTKHLATMKLERVVACISAIDNHSNLQVILRNITGTRSGKEKWNPRMNGGNEEQERKEGTFCFMYRTSKTKIILSETTSRNKSTSRDILTRGRYTLGKINVEVASRYEHANWALGPILEWSSCNSTVHLFTRGHFSCSGY